jgi:cytochrome c oxidase subunit 3
MQASNPHPFHLVRPSPWPILMSFALGLMLFGTVLMMHDVTSTIAGMKIHWGYKGAIVGLLAVLACMYGWWRDVVNEGVKEKAHSEVAKIGFRYGMVLFIISEVFFFFAFFWAFFYIAFLPGAGIDFTFPPKVIETIDPFHLPFLMTLILLLSGCSVTWAHHAFMENNIKEAKQGLAVTVALGVIFSFLQFYEYHHAPFGFKDTVYASVFYMATGFHGLHVIIGTIFLYICLLRTQRGHFTQKDHFGFEAAAWYWHFVDVVWLFLFIAVYWWGGQ